MMKKKKKKKKKRKERKKFINILILTFVNKTNKMIANQTSFLSIIKIFLKIKFHGVQVPPLTQNTH